MKLTPEGYKRVLHILIQKGDTPNDARLILDLALHAIDEAFEAIGRVADRAPTEILQLKVASLAMTMVGTAAQTELREAVEYAKAHLK